MSVSTTLTQPFFASTDFFAKFLRDGPIEEIYEEGFDGRKKEELYKGRSN